MRTHTEGFKNNIKKLGRQIRSKIIFTIDNVETILVDEDINNVSLSTKTSLLKSVMKELQIDVNQDIPLGTILEYQFGLKVGEQYEYITYGNFIVNKVEKQEDTRSWIITCYDKMLYSMIKYEGVFLEYPVTIRDYINALCTNIGLEFKNASDEFCNYDKLVNEDLFINQNVTYRDVLDQLAEVTGSNICISNDDKLELRYIASNSPTPVRPSKNIVDTQGFQNGYINSSGSFVSDNKTALLNYKIPVEAGKTYCFSTNANVDNMVISMFGSSDNFLRRQKVSNTNKLTQLMANDVAYVRYAVNYNNSATMTQEIIDSLEIMCEEGSERTVPYEPYGLIEMGKNLLNTDLYEKGYYGYPGIFIEDDTVATFNQYIPVEEDIYYNISANSIVSELTFYAYDSNKTLLYSLGTTDASQFNYKFMDAEYLRVGIKVDNNEITDEIIEGLEIMLEKGRTRTVPYEPYVEPPTELDTIDEEYLKDINVKFGEKFGPVNSIVLSRAADSDRIYNSDDESIALYGLTEIKISENQFMNFNDRDQYLPDLLEQLDGLEFYINDYSSTGIMYYELGDFYNVKIGDNTYKTLMLSDCIEINSGLQEDIYLDHPEKSDTDYTKTDKTDNKINQTTLIVNKQTGDIEALTSRVQNTEDGLNNTYTIEQTNQLIQNAIDGITNQFTVKGGNNLLRNTGLWFENKQTINLFDGKLELGGYTDGEKDNYTDRFRCVKKIPVTPNTSYIFSIDGVVYNEKVQFYNGNTYIEEITTSNGKFTTGNNVTYITFRCMTGDFVSDFIGLKIQLQEGNNATSYEEYYSPYEYWNAYKIKRVREDNAVNSYAILLQNDIASQQVVDVKNGTYTLSFNYRKLILQSSSTVTINDTTIELNEMEDTPVEIPIEVGARNINLEFVSNEDDSCIIYDLMLNSGESKSEYSQNENETTTDTVNIGKGITITSTDTDVTFKANATGIRTVDRNGNKKTEFTDVGMETVSAEITEEAKITGLLHRRVGNHIWVTKL